MKTVIFVANVIGVAILARGRQLAERRRGLPGDPDDTHSRYVEAEIDGLVVGCLYLPNGNPAPGPKFDYKPRWFERLNRHASDLIASGRNVVLCGEDFNVVPTEIDAVAPRRWLGDAVFFPEGRDAYAQLLEQGWVDAVRAIHPDKGVYTDWNFAFRGGYDKSSGLRMDHLLISPTLASRLETAGVDVESRSWEKPSTGRRGLPQRTTPISAVGMAMPVNVAYGQASQREKSGAVL